MQCSPCSAPGGDGLASVLVCKMPQLQAAQVPIARPVLGGLANRSHVLLSLPAHALFLRQGTPTAMPAAQTGSPALSGHSGMQCQGQEDSSAERKLRRRPHQYVEDMCAALVIKAD